MLGAAATSLLSLLPTRDGDSLVSPTAQRLEILKELVRQLVIAHDLAILAVWAEWGHTSGLEVMSCRIIDLEVKGIIGDQGKEHVARIDANAAEHATGADLWEDAIQLLEDEVSKTQADRHEEDGEGGGVRLTHIRRLWCAANALTA